ncbi:MAG: phage integrase SAM-like domain-containing protein, partial [Candidatus Hermodarchaeota archaeon]
MCFLISILDIFIWSSFNGFIESNLYRLSETKAKQHLTMVEHLRNYAGEIQFKDVNQDLIEGFEAYLRGG